MPEPIYDLLLRGGRVVVGGANTCGQRQDFRVLFGEDEWVFSEL
ncbi:hypothetical protein [Nodosilinea sp. P-1105]|nr:hypothetical protein [Nodosilinea sp. P-1105]